MLGLISHISTRPTCLNLVVLLLLGSSSACRSERPVQTATGGAGADSVTRDAGGTGGTTAATGGSWIQGAASGDGATGSSGATGGVGGAPSGAPSARDAE
jgi:hypothetical protein